MIKLKSLALLLLAGYVVAAPSSKEEDKPIIVNEKFYPEAWKVYESEHDIVSILVPLNSINFAEDTSNEEGSNVIMFFVEADIVDGKRVDKGLYLFKNNKATKILDNGREAAASGDDSKLVFLAASDGLYVYKEEKNAAEKYGSINEDLIGVAKVKDGEVVYILTANNEVYKVSDGGNVKERINEIAKADQIVADYDNNLFFTNDNRVYVYNINGTKEINIPHGSSVTLIKPPYLLDDGIPCVVDDKSYIVYANGTSEAYLVEFKPNYKPTAFSMEAALLQYHAHDKKIYEYNLVKIIEMETVDLDNVVGDKKDKIKSFASSKKTYN